MKTPEELAGEYTRKRYGDTDWKIGLGQRSARRGGVSISIESAFLAGYHSRDEEIAMLKAELREIENE